MKRYGKLVKLLRSWLDNLWQGPMACLALHPRGDFRGWMSPARGSARLVSREGDSNFSTMPSPRT